MNDKICPNCKQHIIKTKLSNAYTISCDCKTEMQVEGSIDKVIESHLKIIESIAQIK